VAPLTVLSRYNPRMPKDAFTLSDLNEPTLTIDAAGVGATPLRG
jgi:hypothetical protein